MIIETLPVWKNLSPLKKPFHLGRFFLARNYAKTKPRSMFVGITGSVGKTTTTVCCTNVLSQKFSTISSINTSSVLNLDPIFNIPMTILRIRPKTQKVILEMGIEYPNEMDFYFTIVQPGVAIITTVAYSHSVFLGSIDQIYEEKSKLVKQLPDNGVAILNYDDPLVRKMADLTKAEVVYYGTDPKHCQVWAGNIKVNNFHTHFELNYGVERVEVEFKLLGRHQIYSALAAAALGLSQGMSLISIKKGLEQVEQSEHRLHVLQGQDGSIIVDDTYNNSSPIGIEAALDLLNDLPAKRRILVYGEMKELGQYSEKMHRRVAEKIAKNKVDLVLLGPGETKYIEEELKLLGFPEDRVESNLTNQQMVARILRTAHVGDVILVKGSRSGRLDDVVKRITRDK